MQFENLDVFELLHLLGGLHEVFFGVTEMLIVPIAACLYRQSQKVHLTDLLEEDEEKEVEDGELYELAIEDLLVMRHHFENSSRERLQLIQQNNQLITQNQQEIQAINDVVRNEIEARGGKFQKRVEDDFQPITPIRPANTRIQNWKNRAKTNKDGYYKV